MTNLSTINCTEMGNRKNKVSRGLNRLLQSNRNNHFTNQDVFVSDPNMCNSYFDLFYQAQLTEIAYSGQGSN